MSLGGPLKPTEGATKLPPHLRFHTVPRDLRWALPNGWAYCGPMFAGALRSDTRCVILSRDLWPERVQDVMGGIVVVSAVAATLMPEAGFPWAGLWQAPPRAVRLRPRVPRLLALSGGQALRVTKAQCRQGELFVWPVEVKDSGPLR